MKHRIPGVVLRFSFCTTAVKDSCSLTSKALQLKVYEDTA
jgi:hypothetical protein